MILPNLTSASASGGLTCLTGFLAEQAKFYGSTDISVWTSECPANHKDENVCGLLMVNKVGTLQSTGHSQTDAFANFVLCQKSK